MNIIREIEEKRHISGIIYKKLYEAECKCGNIFVGTYEECQADTCGKCKKKKATEAE